MLLLFLFFFFFNDTATTEIYTLSLHDALPISRNITVNAVAPGFVETPMTDVLSDKVKEELKARIPLGRLGSARDVAAAIVFLASDEASYITGHILNVNGGMHLA